MNYNLPIFFFSLFSLQLAVQGSLPGVRAGHAAVNIGTKVEIEY